MSLNISLFVLYLFIKDRDCTPPTPVVFSMRIMVQWMCEVGAFFFFLRDNILVMQPDWVATRCKTQPSNVDAQLTPFVAFPFNLFSDSDAAFGGRRSAAASAPTASHLVKQPAGGETQCVDRLLCCVDCCCSSTKVPADCCSCCRRPVRSGRTALKGLFDV